MHERIRFDSDRRACRAIKHPHWKFQVAIRRATIPATPADIAGRPLDHLVNVDNASDPWMKEIQYLALLRPVGVPSLLCTTAYVRIRRSPTGHPRSSETSTSPLPPASATVRTSTQDSTYDCREEGAHLRRIPRRKLLGERSRAAI